MNKGTVWLVVGAVVIVGYFLWKRGSGASIQQIGGASGPNPNQASASALLSGLAPIAAAEVAATSADKLLTEQIAASDRVNAANISTAQINAAATVAAANRAASAQNNKSFLDGLSNLIPSVLAFL